MNTLTFTDIDHMATHIDTYLADPASPAPIVVATVPHPARRIARIGETPFNLPVLRRYLADTAPNRHTPDQAGRLAGLVDRVSVERADTAHPSYAFTLNLATTLAEPNEVTLTAPHATRRLIEAHDYGVILDYMIARNPDYPLQGLLEQDDTLFTLRQLIPDGPQGGHAGSMVVGLKHAQKVITVPTVAYSALLEAHTPDGTLTRLHLTVITPDPADSTVHTHGLTVTAPWT